MKFSVFLMEQILAILFFALTAAVCVQLFVASNNMSNDSADLNYALMMAQNGAEAYKASNGDMQETANLLQADTEVSNDAITIYYDKDWNICSSNKSSFAMQISTESSPAAGLSSAVVSVVTYGGSKDTLIFELPVIAREVR